MKGVVMDNAAFRVSRTFELFVNNLLKRVYERQKNEEAVVTKEEAYQLVEAVIAESRASVSEEIENRVATKQFVEAEMAKVKNELVTREVLEEALKPYTTKDFVRAEIAEAKQELKQDIAEVRQEIAEVKQSISKLETKGLYWLIGVGVTSAIIIIGANWALISFLVNSLSK